MRCLALKGERTMKTCPTRLFGCASLAVLLLPLGGSGCDAPRDDDALAEEAPLRAEAEITPDPNSTYFTKVVANGTGCPKGTWDTSVSRDGLVFTTTFSAYVAELSPNTTVAVKDCQLTIGLHTPAGKSFSVASMSFHGYALLEPGVVGRQAASYYFQGKPVGVKAERTDTVGPYDDPFVFTDEVEVEDAVWSPCGAERDLAVATRIVLQNPKTPGGSGYMNIAATDGSALVIKFAARSCSDAGSEGTRTGTKSSDAGMRR